jgi:PBSX family phage terminase large subunit
VVAVLSPPAAHPVARPIGKHKVRYAPLGASRTVLERQDNEVLVEGPAGTGKTVGCLWKVHAAALRHPGMRALVLRKTLVSLTSSALVTYRRHVLASGDYGVRFFGGNKEEPASYRYPNGSELVVGGMDKASKVLSSEYDLAYINEATELTLDDWENVTGRLRYGVMPYQQLLADCNPDVPTHWLNQRAIAGQTVRLLSRHQDNPRYWDVTAGDWTDEGRSYVVEKLGKLTGVRRKRLLDGIWAAAEGQIYEEWDPAVHLIDRFEIPNLWPRYWSIDFGFTNPFVWAAWAMDPDGRLYRYRELYQTGLLVEDAALQVNAITAGEPRRPRHV